MLKAYAKVNLSLKIVNVLPNNYHTLEAVNVKIDLVDEIKITESAQMSVGYQNFHINKDEDTIVKFLNEVQKVYNIPNLYIWINKKIPVGSGMGGLSSDIAAIFNYINKKYKLGLTFKQMVKFVLPFGTDICYQLQDKPALVKGIGDVIIPLNIKLPKKIMVFSPKITVQTKDIYSLVTKYQKESYSKVLLETFGLNELKWIYTNDLEDATFKKYPEIKRYITELKSYHIGKVQMTGSGSSILIYNQDKYILSKLKEKYPDVDINIYKIKK